MGLFNKKIKMQSEPIDKETHADEEVKETVKAVDDARVALEEIKNELNRMNNDSNLAYEMKISADKNYAKMEKLSEAVGTDNKDFRDKRNISIYDLESDLYIVNSEKDSSDLDAYNRALSDLAKFFNDKEAVESVMTGADKINVCLMQYVKSLGEALRTGKKMKANACIDVLKYALTIGYKDEGIIDNEKYELRINEKVKFVKETCNVLLETIDKYYEDIAHYEIEQYAYKQASENYAGLCEEIEKIPEDILRQFENLGFKRAFKELPQGDVAREYIPKILEAQTSATDVLLHSSRIEALLLQLVRLNSNIKELFNEFKHAFALGAEFDYDKHKKTMVEIRKRSIDQVNKMNNMAVESQRMNEETISLINEASENAALGKAVSDSMKTINKLNQIYKKNEEINKRISDRKAEIEREKHEQNLEIETMPSQDQGIFLEN